MKKIMIRISIIWITIFSSFIVMHKQIHSEEKSREVPIEPEWVHPQAPPRKELSEIPRPHSGGDQSSPDKKVPEEAKEPLPELIGGG